MPTRAETRDLLAERIRRLEKRIGDLGDQIGTTANQVERASQQLDALVGLVGRLSHVVDIQGDSLQGDEDQLDKKIDLMEGRVVDLARGLHAIASRLDALGSSLSSHERSKKPTRKPARGGGRAKARTRIKPRGE